MGLSSSKSSSHVLPNPTTSATESDNVKVVKRLTEKSVTAKSQKSEAIGGVTSSVVKRVDGNIPSGKAENTSKNSSINNHDDGACTLRRSSRLAEARSGSVNSTIAHDISPTPSRKRKDLDLDDSKLSSESHNNKKARKGKALSIEIVSGPLTLNLAIFRRGLFYFILF